MHINIRYSLIGLIIGTISAANASRTHPVPFEKTKAYYRQEAFLKESQRKQPQKPVLERGKRYNDLRDFLKESEQDQDQCKQSVPQEEKILEKVDQISRKRKFSTLSLKCTESLDGPRKILQDFEEPLAKRQKINVLAKTEHKITRTESLVSFSSPFLKINTEIVPQMALVTLRDSSNHQKEKILEKVDQISRKRKLTSVDLECTESFEGSKKISQEVKEPLAKRWKINSFPTTKNKFIKAKSLVSYYSSLKNNTEIVPQVTLTDPSRKTEKDLDPEIEIIGQVKQKIHSQPEEIP